jgi:formylmethanofuran dehydrogenase subunit E
MIEQTIRFHGHSCPGLAIGMRAAEILLEKFGHAADEEVVETDMCAVDAVQFLTGCTFGSEKVTSSTWITGKLHFHFIAARMGRD